MKKVKLVLIAVAILLSVGGAFATRAHSSCQNNPQYYFNGATYLPAGQEGLDYICEGGGNTCTYYQVSGGYAACVPGQYTPAD